MSKFIQQAYKGKNDWWRYLLTVILVFIGWQILGVIPLLSVAFSNVDNWAELELASKDMFTSIGIDSNLYLLLMIISFFFGLIFLLLSIKTIHLRKVKTLITSRSSIDWKRVLFAFMLWFSISIIVLIVDYLLNSENYTWNFNPIPFFILVLVSFVFLPLQTSFEELLFRGYFMQGLGLAFKNSAVPLIMTSLIFGLMHIFNPEVEKLGHIILIYYIVTGLLFGIITLMDEGTELALGLHAANNIAAAVIVTTDWMVFQTDALLVDTSEPSVGIEMFIPLLILYPLVIYIFYKKYSWTEWKTKLFGNIDIPEDLASISINDQTIDKI